VSLTRLPITSASDTRARNSSSNRGGKGMGACGRQMPQAITPPAANAP
jgi:hypothetical protein